VIIERRIVVYSEFRENYMKIVWRYTFITTFLIPVFILLFQNPASSINFHIKPVRIFLDKQIKTEKLIITNLGDNDLSLQLKVYKWSQDTKGDDTYEETTDIIVFPKIFTMKKEEERIIRVGTKLSPGVNEKTYRIYIEEMPVKGPLPEGATVRIIAKTGVPLFISPVKADTKGKIESITLKNGAVEIAVKNEGNLHFMIKSINIKGKNIEGKDIFTKELSGWYLLNGASRLYTTPIPEEICRDISKLYIEVKTDRFNLNGKLDVDKAKCQP
jgi:fimbrial chaperone protein